MNDQKNNTENKNQNEEETQSQKGIRHTVDHDAQSDPARNDQLGTDWSGEGGATPTGPATHTRAE